MNSVADIKIADFDYNLPDERIAKYPLPQRDKCKLLTLDPKGCVSHHTFDELPQFIPADTLMVCNNTRVINARMHFKKSTGATIEIFCLEPDCPADYAQIFQTTRSCRWVCLIGNLKRWKEPTITKEVNIEGIDSVITLSATRVASHGNAWVVEFEWDNPDVTFASIIEAAGYIPIPPYLNRQSEETDSVDYQTVYSKIKGSVAAPTAGLHFTDELFDLLRYKGVQLAELTLHVGAGTFQPVKSDTIGEHPMHTEVFTIQRALVEKLIDQLASGKHIVAVGTTSVRTLESLYYIGKHIAANPQIEQHQLHVTQWEAYQQSDTSISPIHSLETLLNWLDQNALASFTASTSIMIAPGYEWKIVDGIVTNFHQPQSTLLLLVSSFIDKITNEWHSNQPKWRQVYDEALANQYRFLSYGDSSLFKSW